MKVTLIDHTGYGNPDKWHPVNVLIFTKSTRLNMLPGLMAEISSWPEERKLHELEYMANTIPSSWEFVDYTFLIEGVTRAFTHQLVRTRTASFAQQTMRVLDVSTGHGWDYMTGPSIPEKDEKYEDAEDPSYVAPLLARQDHYHSTMQKISEAYRHLIAHGAKIEDARGILPTNILTNIVMKLNMRNFCDLVRKRSSPRTQGEYRDVLRQMTERVLEAHPWMKLFLDRDGTKAIEELQANLRQLVQQGMSEERFTHMTKLLDQLRACT